MEIQPRFKIQYPMKNHIINAGLNELIVKYYPEILKEMPEWKNGVVHGTATIRYTL
jgi:hypothetical protein